jgi:hypothetical protein
MEIVVFTWMRTIILRILILAMATFTAVLIMALMPPDLFANSISEHWSVGGYVDYFSSTYSNYDADFSLFPAIEYNVFPYSKSNTKLLTISYKAGPDYAIYTDTTVFNKKEELLFRERLEVELSLIQKWGSVSFGLNGTIIFMTLVKIVLVCLLLLAGVLLKAYRLIHFLITILLTTSLIYRKGS